MARKRYKPEEIVAKVAASGCSSLPRSGHGRRDPPDWCERSNLLSLAPGVRRAEDRASQAPEGPRTREQPAAQGGLRFDAGQAHSSGGRPGKLLSPARRRACIEQVRAQLHVSERRACAALGQHRSTQRKVPRGRDDEERLTADIIELARQYGRYGYRKIAGLLRQAGWLINDKRVERIWRREGLKVPHKQPKRGKLWRTDRASGCGRSTAITSGPTTLSRTAPTTDAGIGCSTCSTSSPMNVWRSVSPASSRRSMSSMYCPTSSSYAAYPVTSGPTTDLSSSPRPCRSGSLRSVPRPLTSSEAALGRTATSRASMPACATSCSTARSSVPYARPRSSPSAGGVTTSAHHNTHLSMSLKRTCFADRDAIPRGALGSGVRVR